MANVVGQKGQVVISKEIRDKLGIEPGWMALQSIVGDHMEIYFVPPEHTRSLKGSLARHISGHISQGQEWDEARDAAWNQAAKAAQR